MVSHPVVGHGEVQGPGLSELGSGSMCVGSVVPAHTSVSPSTLWRPWGGARWQESGKGKLGPPLPPASLLKCGLFDLGV